MTESGGFDRKYFDKWYRNPKHTVRTRSALLRQAALAIAGAEYLLERPIRSVLDIGAGEGEWYRAIRALRPRADYAGLEPSAYAVRRYGRRRHISLGGLGTLGAVADLERFDLVVCVDVMHYVETADLRAGIKVLGARLRGVAMLHAFARADAVEGDTGGMMRRTAAWYRRLLRSAGLREAGLSFWISPRSDVVLSSLEAPK